MTEYTTIRLYGKLGGMFGRVHRLAVASAQEAVLALSATLPGFEKEMLASEGRGVRYAIFHGKRNIGAPELGAPSGREDIRIAPILQGAKRGGLFQTVLGAVMIAAAIYGGVGALSFAALGAEGAIVAPALFGMGVSLALGGVMQMISPQQRALSAKDSPENGASYNFNGPVNTTAQGNCYPVLYGELYVGSQVLSAGIFAEDQA